MVPGNDLAVGVEARLDVLQRGRPELAAAHVVLAAPNQLDRLADRLGQPHRIRDDLVLRAAAVTAADPVLVHCDVAGRGLEEAGDLGDEAARSLGADP